MNPARYFGKSFTFLFVVFLCLGAVDLRSTAYSAYLYSTQASANARISSTDAAPLLMDHSIIPWVESSTILNCSHYPVMVTNPAGGVYVQNNNATYAVTEEQLAAGFCDGELVAPGGQGLFALPNQPLYLVRSITDDNGEIKSELHRVESLAETTRLIGNNQANWWDYGYSYTHPINENAVTHIYELVTSPEGIPYVLVGLKDRLWMGWNMPYGLQDHTVLFVINTNDSVYGITSMGSRNPEFECIFGSSSMEITEENLPYPDYRNHIGKCSAHGGTDYQMRFLENGKLRFVSNATSYDKTTTGSMFDLETDSWGGFFFKKAGIFGGDSIDSTELKTVDQADFSSASSVILPDGTTWYLSAKRAAATTNEAGELQPGAIQGYVLSILYSDLTLRSVYQGSEECSFPLPNQAFNPEIHCLPDGKMGLFENGDLLIHTAQNIYRLKMNAQDTRPQINQPPVFTSTAPTTATAGTAYSYQAAATDPENDTLVFTLETAPTGMTIVGDTINWTPAAAQIGTHNVKIKVDDGNGGTAEQEFTITVSAANQAPTFTSTAPITATAGTAYSYQAAATDPENDTLIFTLETAPVGMTIAGDTISWTPTADQVGTHNVKIKVDDGNGGTAEQEFTITVSAANQAPTFTSTAPTTATAGTAYSYQAAATDPENDTLVFTLETAPTGMTIASDTISWTPAVAQIGTHNVKIKVDDGNGGTAEQEFTITVSAANQAPTFTSTAPTTATAGTAYSYQAAATDPENDTLVFTLETAPTGMTIAGDTISWTPAADQVGTHNVKIKVDDGNGGTAEQEFTITVSAANQAPTFTSTAPTTATAGTAYSYQAAATDPENDTLVFMLETAPAGMTIAGDTISWTPASDQVGTHNVKIKVDDGNGGTAEQEFTITVSAANQAPTFTSTAPTTATAGTAYSYQAAATDPENDTLIFTLETAPAGMTIAGDTISWTPASDQVGTHNVKIKVDDGNGGTAEQEFAIIVSAAVNHAPTITSTPVTQTTAGNAYHYLVTATDPENDTLTYQLTTAPTGMSIHHSSGQISWSAPTAGNHPVIIQVSDSAGNHATQTYTLNVTAALINHAPVITSTPITVATVGIPYSYQVTATDEDGDILNYSLIAAPAGMSIHNSTGRISWNPTAAGSIGVQVQVSDGSLTAVQNYTIMIENAVAPLSGEISVTPQSVTAGTPVTLQTVATGGTEPYTYVIYQDDVQIATSATVNTQSATAGRHEIRVEITDQAGRTTQATSWYSVTVAPDTTPPIAVITAPSRSNINDPASITTISDVTGTATDNVGIAEYTLSISYVGENNWNVIHRSHSAVVNGKLGSLNPQTLPNGQFDLRLDVVDLAGNRAQAQTTVVIYGEQKVGQFALTFTDFNIDVGNIPLMVNRTYDTMRQFEKLDFGYGWSMDAQNVKIQTNGVPGYNWQMVTTGSGFNKKVCPRAIGSRVVTIRMPDGKLHQFDVKTEPECRPQMQASNFFDVKFVPRAGTTSTLTSPDLVQMRVHGNELVDYYSLEALDLRSYTLTTYDKTVYELDAGLGIRSITDRRGNKLTYTANGIQHSDGLALQFTRDAAGRISKITAPDGRVREYRYDEAGNLQEAQDPKEQVTRQTYHLAPSQKHFLHEIYAADGSRIFKAEFDENGQLVSQTDGKGYSVNLSHDIDNNKDVATDRRGNTTAYVYDNQGNVTEVTDALGNTTRYTYDANGNETSITNALGHTTQQEFDLYGNVTKEVDPLGNETLTAYNADGNPTTVTDALGRITRTNYNLNGEPTQLVDAAGHATNIGYTPKGNLSSITDALGNQTRFSYTTINNKQLKTSETDALGNVTRYEYDTQGNQTTTRKTVTINGSEVEVVTSQTFDDNGNVTSSTDAAGQTTIYEYDELDQLTQETDPQGRITRYETNDRGEQVKVTYPDGTISSTDYDANGNEIKSCSDGVCTETTYDELDRPITVTGGGTTSTTLYDAAGQVSATQDAYGNLTSYEYDAAGRQTKVKTPLGHESESVYDAVGNLIQKKDAKGQAVQHIYNANNQKEKTIFADGTELKYEYDAAGRRTAMVDAAGNRISYRFDVLSRLQKVINSLNQETVYTYNEQGNLISQTDAALRTTQFQYDALGRRTARVLPNGATERWAYDSTGKLTSHTDFKGQVTQFDYDANDRMVRTTYADGETIETDYQTGFRSRLNAIRNANKTLSYQYDENTGQTLQVGDIAQTFDANGARKTVTDLATATTYGLDYNADRQLSKLSDNGNDTTFAYDAVGNQTQISKHNGTTLTATYDSKNQVTSVRHADEQGRIFLDFAYDRDANGRIIKRTENVNGTAKTLEYAYDVLGRLMQEKENGQVIRSYTFDSASNRASKTEHGVTTTYTYDTQDRLTKETTNGVETVYSYDANGSLIRKQSPAETVDYTWNARNRLTKVQTANATVEYQYDPLGNLIERKETRGANVTETQFRWDTERAYAELISSQTRTNGGFWSTTFYFFTPDGTGELLYTRDDQNNLRFFHGDAQSTTRAITDATGNVLETLEFDSNGNRLSGTTTATHQYAGEILDEVSGFYYLRARWMNPEIGRFVSRDEFEGALFSPATLNAYIYGNADAINIIDPSGYFGLVGISMSMNLSGMMRSIGGQMLRDYVWTKIFGDDNSEVFSLFDALMAMMIKAIFADADTHSLALVPLAARTMGIANDPKHHTIPIYMCGKDQSSNLIQIPRADHNILHGTLDGVTQAINIAGKAYALAFRRGGPKQMLLGRPMMNRFARTVQGRSVISAALLAFYQTNGYMGLKSDPSPLAPTLGMVFVPESVRYINSRRNTSWPKCKR